MEPLTIFEANGGIKALVKAMKANTPVADEWPKEVPFDPHRYFFFAGFCLLAGQSVSFAGAILMRYCDTTVIPRPYKAKAARKRTLFGQKRQKYTYLATDEVEGDEGMGLNRARHEL